MFVFIARIYFGQKNLVKDMLDYVVKRRLTLIIITFVSVLIFFCSYTICSLVLGQQLFFFCFVSADGITSLDDFEWVVKSCFVSDFCYCYWCCFCLC